MRVAFKEWAVVCEALATGRQVLILRKGGIHEDEFRPEHDEFLLFPTYLHESPESVLPEARPIYERVMATRPEPDTVRIGHFAVVTDAIELKSLEALRALRGQHIWADPVVEERFHRWRKDSVHAIVTRVLSLPQAHSLPNTPAYAGCKSWVHLDRDVSVENAGPVLTDTEFDGRACAVRIALGNV